MDKRTAIEIGRNVVLFFGQMFILLLCIGFIRFTYQENILPDKNVAETFPVTDCMLVSKTLATKGRVVPRYRADFLVNYTANGLTYQSIASGNGLDYAFTANRSSQEAILNEFDVGVSYPCWYDPTRPQIVVIVLRHSWTSTFPLIVPSVIALVMVYYIFKTLFKCLELGVVAQRRRKRRRSL